MKKFETSMKVKLEDLQQIFQRAMLYKGRLSLELTSKTVKEWDSINHLNLILELEEFYSVKLSQEEIIALNSVGQIFQIIGKKQPA
jgi:acyl carrier protein